MKRHNYKLIVYFIAITILATIGIQLYWNVENYKTNKQRLINEVQISLDLVVENYYANLAKNKVMTITESDLDNGHVTQQIIRGTAKSIYDKIPTDTIFNVKDSLHNNNFNKSLHITKANLPIDSNSGWKVTAGLNSNGISKMKRILASDTIYPIRELTTKIMISFTNDTLNFKEIDSLLTQEFQRKKLAFDYRLVHSKKDSIIGFFQNGPGENSNWLSASAKSTYLPYDQKLELKFSNPTLTVLKRSITGILLSLVLSASIIFCLLYLLRTIYKQKELAEIKNDLISNITHEFKTPISTVSTAIEGIKNFTESGDTQKTNKYLDIGNQQLKKLHLMVEKLLETATLDSDKLLLSKKTINMVSMLKTISEKHQMLAESKNILFTSNLSELEIEVDPFHFENAISNLIDNAVKYGGDTIEVNLNSLLNTIEITVADNGAPIEKPQREKIFDKFYRIPTGNRHDVKGFGIGLFYTKKIIEKHGGNIMLVPNTKNTIFKVTL